MSNIRVDIKNPDQFEKYFRKFCNIVKKDGFLQELRDRRYYKKPSEVKRLKRKLAKTRKSSDR